MTDIETAEQAMRQKITGLTQDVGGYINPANDGMLAPWMMARVRALEAVDALTYAIDAIGARPYMNPGQAALAALAAEPVDDLLNDLEDQLMDELDRATPIVFAPFNALDDALAMVRPSVAL